jgi:hypothetical protein
VMGTGEREVSGAMEGYVGGSAMKVKSVSIGVPPVRCAVIREFLHREALEWVIVDPSAGGLRIVEAAPKTECSGLTLHPGGWVPCAVALAIAESCAVPGKTVGRLLDLLEIKVRDCQLGCFP